jgi:hypothetical protein
VKLEGKKGIIKNALEVVMLGNKRGKSLILFCFPKDHTITYWLVLTQHPEPKLSPFSLPRNTIRIVTIKNDNVASKTSRLSTEDSSPLSS